MRSIVGPAAFVLSLVLTIGLAVSGWTALAVRGIHQQVLVKHSPDVARWMLNEGRLDLTAFQSVVNTMPHYGELSIDPSAPEHGLGRWLVAYHTRSLAARLTDFGVVFFVGAGVSLCVTCLIWLQRPKVDRPIVTPTPSP